jgi:hypothetical protein
MEFVPIPVPGNMHSVFAERQDKARERYPFSPSTVYTSKPEKSNVAGKVRGTPWSSCIQTTEMTRFAAVKLFTVLAIQVRSGLPPKEHYQSERSIPEAWKFNKPWG